MCLDAIFRKIYLMPNKRVVAILSFSLLVTSLSWLKLKDIVEIRRKRLDERMIDTDLLSFNHSLHHLVFAGSQETSTLVELTSATSTSSTPNVLMSQATESLSHKLNQCEYMLGPGFRILRSF